jgi:predicted nucleic acid-binding protein
VSYLLDTNVISETRKRRPEFKVIRWLETSSPDAHYLSVLTIGKIKKGIVQHRRREFAAAQRLELWLNGLRELFAERILAVGDSEATLWGELAGNSALPVVDGLLAATALVHDLTLVTRNTKDFARIDVALLDPWQDGG